MLSLTALYCVSVVSAPLNGNRGVSGEGSEGDVRYYDMQCTYIGREITVELETEEGDVSALKM